MDNEVFFTRCREGLMGPEPETDEGLGTHQVLSAMRGRYLTHVAYALATAWHETAHTMQPINEFGGDAYYFRMYDPEGSNPKLAAQLGNTQPGDGARYHGRGYVQLTGRDNYKRAGKALSLDLENNPKWAKQPETAARIMREGMTHGWFTGKQFVDYLPARTLATRSQFYQARRIINGIDKASLIAGYAMEFQAALEAALYT